MSEMTVHETLVKARKLIERPEDWSGEGWGWNGPRCGIHAVHDALGLDDAGLSWTPVKRGAVDLLALAAGLDDRNCFADWNDSHAYVEVLAAFDKAIAATAPMPADPFPTPDPEDRVLELVA